MKKMLILVVLLFFAFASLFGVNAIGLGTTAIGVSKALNGDFGTFIYAKDAFMVFGWPHKGQYAFLITKTNGELVRNIASIPGFTGQRMDTMTAVQFVRMLETLGFRTITPAEVPPAVVATFGSWKYALGLASFPRLTVLLLPVEAFDFAVEVKKDG